MLDTMTCDGRSLSTTSYIYENWEENKKLKKEQIMQYQLSTINGK